MFSSRINPKWPLYLSGLMLIVGLGCTRYYKPVPADTSTPQATENFIVKTYQDKVLILRHGKRNYRIERFTIDHEKMAMQATLKPIDPSFSPYIVAKGRKYGYTDRKVLREMHIFIADTVAVDPTGLFVLPLNKIERIEIIEHDKNRTATSYTVGTIVTVVGIVAIIAAIATASAVQSMNNATSCPYVSTYKDGHYSMQGELYAGAIKQSMERPDYLPIDLQPVNDVFQIKLSNELKEKQYTNHADLIVMEHRPGKRAYIGVDGKTYLLSDPVSPVSATLNDNRNMLDAISRKDNLTCSFDDTVFTSAQTDLTLTFSQNPNQGKAKLVLNLRNSIWLDHLYNEFATSFGGRYDGWQSKLDKRDGDDLYQWLDEQQIPLSISIGTANGWKEIAKLNTIGPLMHRQVVVPIQLDEGSSEPVRIRLSTGFLFWEVDYAAMDFSVDEPVMTTTLKPYSAIDQKGNNVLASILNDDAQYLTQPETGDFAVLKYKLENPLSADKAYSYVLSASGYYEPIRNPEGKADLSFIRKFKKPGAMNTFSKERYRGIFEAQSVTVFKADE